ncbi:hydrogenase small subunit [Chloroflexota bacterium]
MKEAEGLRMDRFLLAPSEITRREFLEIASATLALLGLSQALTPQVVKALEKSLGKTAVVWLEGQDCAGCTESFVNSTEPLATSILLDSISLRYHETLMAASGHQAEEARGKAIEEGGYLLVIEGAIPMAEDGLYCTVGGKAFKDIVWETARRAAAIIPIGACATYGGIPRSGPTDAVGYLFRGTKKHHYFDDVTTGKPVINLPTCPVHPERLVAVLVHYLTFGTVPPLDKFHRPLAFYGSNQHENCERRGHFDAGRFMVDWGNPKQHDWCLYLKGCRGPVANQDCWKRLWNNRTNYCIQANTPCLACSEPEFYESFSPLYERRFDVKLPGIGLVPIDKIMATAAGLLSAGIGVDMLINHIQGKKSRTAGKKAEEKKT